MGDDGSNLADMRYHARHGTKCRLALDMLNSTQSTRNAVIKSRPVCFNFKSGLRDRSPLNCGPTARRAAD